MGISDVVVREGLDPNHETQLSRLFEDLWWTEHRTVEQTRAALLASSVVLSAVDRSSDELVGFTRVITDGVFVAVVLDLVVGAGWRGAGVGALLMDSVTSHPLLRAVESLELVCQPELTSFYKRWGFTDQVGSSRLMRRTERASLVGPPLAIVPPPSA